MVNRFFYKIALCLLVAASAPVPRAQEASGGHFYFAGPLARLAADGVEVAPIGSGLPFSLVLSDGGSKVSPAQFDLKVPGASAPLRLAFENLKFAGGRLTGDARITNSTGSVVEGLRLDLVSASEEFQTKDTKGAPALSTRAQAVSLASPLFFGDLSKGESSDAVPFDASNVRFAPETTKVTLSGVVSGLRYAGAFNVPDVSNPAQIDSDAQGRLYLCDVTGNRVVRTDAEGRGAETVARLEDQCLGAAVNPKTGEVYATRANSTDVYTFAGAAAGRFDGGDYLSFLRFDRRGNFYASGGHVFRFAAGKVALDLKELAGEGLSAKGIDVDAAGQLWVVSGLEDKRTLFRVAPDGRAAQRVSAGKDWRPGRLDVPESVRVDAAGNAYVAELGEEGAEAARVTVFDKAGALVRVFGRGGREPQRDADKVLTGQLWRPRDIAFGADGRVYVAQENDGGFKTDAVLVFQPF